MSYKKELPEGLAEWGCDEELWEQIQSKKGLLDLLRLGDEKRGRARIARLREMITEVAKQPPSGHADRGGQVHGDVAAVHQLGHEGSVGHAADAVVEVVVADQSLEVRHLARREIVEHEHAVAALDEAVGEVRSDEPGTAGDEDLHCALK